MSPVLGADDVASTTDSWQNTLEGVDSPAVKRAVKSFTASVKRLDAEYSKGFDRARDNLAARLKKACDTATKTGDLDAAVRIRDAIKSLSGESDRAVTGTKSPFTKYAGTWTGKWGTTGNPISIVIDKNGHISDPNGPLKPIRGQYLFSTKSQPMVLVPMEGRIVALTWLTGKTPLRDQPRHAAILSSRTETVTKP